MIKEEKKQGEGSENWNKRVEDRRGKGRGMEKCKGNNMRGSG